MRHRRRQRRASPSAAASESAGASASASASAGATPASSGTLRFANWIGYIDVTEDETTHPTLDKFQSETGITVNYQEAVDDNETFFTSDLQAPSTPASRPSGTSSS